MAEINDNLRIASKADLNALTAEDVHARPDTWMPTASDVGAMAMPTTLTNADFDTLPLNSIVNVDINIGDGQSTLHTPRYELYGTTSVDWYEVETFGIRNRTVQIAHAVFNYARQSFIRYKHDSLWSSWKEIGDFKADGSVAMTGTNLWLYNKLGRVSCAGNYVQLDTFNGPDSADNRRKLVLANSNLSTLPNGLWLSDVANGVEKTYNILGEHNYKNYVLPLDGSVAMSGELKYFDGSKTLAYPVPMANAGFHNSVYRGKSLGSAVTDAQWAAIKAGTFDDLFIGDYWTIGGVTYRIAAFDYYYKTGDTSCETHHVTLVPDTSMYTHVMNDTNITDGAYVGSKMYTTGLTQAKTTINNAFGSAHILNHRQYLQNATSNGISTGGAWYDSTIELMTEQNVYGCKIFGDVVHGTTFPNNYTIDKSQYPLFAFRPDMISNHQWFWLRDVANATNFANVYSGGNADYYGASYVGGVRPAFSIVS